MPSRLIAAGDLNSAGFNALFDARLKNEGLSRNVIEIDTSAFTFVGALNTLYWMTGTGNQAVTIDADLDNFPVGASAEFFNNSGGITSFIPDTGVTFITSLSPVEINRPKVSVILTKLDDNIYRLTPVGFYTPL